MNAAIDASTKFGERQRADGHERARTLEIIEASVEYMSSSQFTELTQEIRDNCINRNELCSFWAQIGECEANQGFMKVNCAPACKSCHLIE